LFAICCYAKEIIDLLNKETMNKNILFILIIVIAILLIGGWFYSSRTKDVVIPAEVDDKEMVEKEDTEDTVEKPPTPPTDNGKPPPQPQTSAEVIYTNSGFDPKTVSLENGEEVTFINNSTHEMWIASNMHPTHTLYPEKSSADCLGSSFDTCTRISPGGSWSFAFTKSGTWKYHNHIRANFGGTAVVK